MEEELSNGDIVKFRELTTGDIFDATDAAKDVRVVEGIGPIFVIDQFLMERLLILKSIASVNDAEDVATLAWFRDLPPQDYERLQRAGENIDAATLSEVGNRGRDSAASG